MRTVTEGIVLKETKLTDGRRIINLFTEKFGKISAGTTINEKGKSKAALVLKPFTVAEYSIYSNRNSYTISSAEVKRAYYSLGEDIDRYMAASFVLEFTEKVLLDEQKSPAVYTLLMDFLDEIHERNRKYDTLVIAYEVKILKILGIMPDIRGCIECRSGDIEYFSIEEGCVMCAEHRKSGLLRISKQAIEAIEFFYSKPLSGLKNLGLNKDVSAEVLNLLRKYISCHLEIGTLKSETFFKNSY